MRRLRDVEEYNRDLISEEELAFMQRKISAAGEMKSAIKKVLDYLENNSTGEITGEHYNNLQKAMEGYLNVK